MSRIMTLIRRCKRKGGSCTCKSTSECQAEDAVEQRIAVVKQEISMSTAEMKKLKGHLAYLQRRPATLRPGWKMPPKPEGDYQPCVINDDGWCPHWFSETEEQDYIPFVGDDAWPFKEIVCDDSDWEALGFEVV